MHAWCAEDLARGPTCDPTTPSPTHTQQAGLAWQSLLCRWGTHIILGSCEGILLKHVSLSFSTPSKNISLQFISYSVLLAYHQPDCILHRSVGRLLSLVNPVWLLPLPLAGSDTGRDSPSGRGKVEQETLSRALITLPTDHDDSDHGSWWSQGMHSHKLLALRREH